MRAGAGDKDGAAVFLPVGFRMRDPEVKASPFDAGVAVAHAFGPLAGFGPGHDAGQEGDVDVGVHPAMVIMIHPELDAAAHGDDVIIGEEDGRCGTGRQEQQGAEGQQEPEGRGGCGRGLHDGLLR